MSEYFKQIIFPQKPKPAVVSIGGENSTNMTNIRARAMFETVYCYKQDKWFSMVECVSCKQGNRTLEEILEDGIGCMGD